MAEKPRDSPTVLYHEYGLELRSEGEDLVLNVLCGGVGQFDVEFTFNADERESYRQTGDWFLQKIAADVRHSPHLFAARDRRRWAS